MEEQALSCPICIKLYDSKEHEPHFIPFCGHSLCLTCLKNILHENQEYCKCPLCNKMFQRPEVGITVFPKNYAILDLVDTRRPREFCPIHKSQLELVCLDCKCKICNKCVFKGTHKEHEVDLLENFNFDLENKVKDISDNLVKNESYFSAIESVINVKKESLLASVDQMHNNYVQFLTQKRDTIKKEIEQKFQDILKKGALGFRKSLRENIANWNDTNNLAAGFTLKDESVSNIKNSSNPMDSKHLIQDALVYQVACESELEKKIGNIYELQERKKYDIEVEGQGQEKSYGYLKNILYECSQNNLFISMKNQEINEKRMMEDKIFALPYSEIDSCTIELDSVQLDRRNMELILEIFWNAKSLKSLEFKMKQTTFTKEAIMDFLASICVNFDLTTLTLDFT